MRFYKGFKRYIKSKDAETLKVIMTRYKRMADSTNSNTTFYSQLMDCYDYVFRIYQKKSKK